MSSLATSQIVKCYRSVHIVTRKHLNKAMKQYKDAASEVEAWVSFVEAVRRRSFAEVREIFKNADSVDGYVVFSSRRNRYRLTTVIHYAKTSD